MPVIVCTDELWDVLVGEAAAESPLWADSRRPEPDQKRLPVFSPLVPEPRLSLGVETIYEGYLVHYGRSRLFAPPSADTALLLGDYLYAHGLVRIGETGDVAAVHDLAELISLCSQARADGRVDADGVAWAATAALLGHGDLDAPRRALREDGDASALARAARAARGPEAVEAALVAHARFVR